jgi:hypothetical protein
MLATVQHLPAMRFADAARRLGAAAHGMGLTVPAFRSPPRLAGATRTIRRFPGGVVVSVELRGRPFEVALRDMVEGLLVANRVAPADSSRLRVELLDAVTEAVIEVPAVRAA